MGADPAVTSGDWPDALNAVDPVVYVRPGAAGVGTASDPYGDLTTALAARPLAATVLLSRGRFTLTETVALSRSVVIRGMGPGATQLVPPPGASAVRVGSPDTAVSVTLARLAIHYDTPSTGFAAVSVEGDRARCSFVDVAIAGGADGVRVDQGATACAAGLSVQDAGQRGVVILANSQGFLRDVLVRGSAGVGLLADRSHLSVDRALVAENGRDGIAVRGAWLGASCTSDADCVASPPCPGFALEQRCVVSPGYMPRDGSPAVPEARRCRSTDVVSDIALLRNHATGLRASRTTPTPAEVTAGTRNAVLALPGPEIRAARLVIGDTRSFDGSPGGDGLYVGPAASVSLDESVSTDADRGHASLIVGNARAGVLADGDRSTGDGGVPDGLRRSGRVAVAGARVASNAGPGLFIQERAVADQISYTEVADNTALGLGVTSGGGVALMLCDQFIATRMGTVTPENPSVRPFEVGDGASMSSGTTGSTRMRVIDSEFNDNRRFGLVLDAFDATLDDGTHGGNRGRGNGFGLGVYGAARLDGTTPRTAIQGFVTAAPLSAPTVRASVSAATAGP